jgi:SAM-dependent methyltransferase
MSRWYRFMYGVGFKPWEADAATVALQLDPLLALEEARRERPFGSALDLGCGTGRWSVELARRGWTVVGVDVVPKAIHSAQRRARETGVDVAFVAGDVAALRRAGVGTGFSFFLDVECFNHLSDSQRAAVGSEVNAVASPDATMLLLVWARAHRGPLPRGASADDLTRAFSGWKIVDEIAYDGELPRPLKNIAPRWFRLARS